MKSDATGKAAEIDIDLFELETTSNEREKLYKKFASKLEIAPYLNRQMVSFQANKNEPLYRWFKYKEGFSLSLVKYFLQKYSPTPGVLLDPFAGAGTTLFAGQDLGWKANGIELLPVGSFAMHTRDLLHKVNVDDLQKIIKTLWQKVDKVKNPDSHIKHVSITKDAFPEDTEEKLNKYLSYCSTIKDETLKSILRFIAFSVLEEISFTRKDGQYLRWDYRSKRNLSSKPFDKGKIVSFEDAINNKLRLVLEDISPDLSPRLFEEKESSGTEKLPINVITGSCLDELPKMADDSVDFIVTSPPYCNRYDYTRTYALELVYLGYDTDQIRNLRQLLLSCTVENKEKIEYLKEFYKSINKSEVFDKVTKVYAGSRAMTEVNTVLDNLNKEEKLNNSNIARMVKNYFLELCFTIYEMSRITKSGGYCVMVNDNVRYGGEEIPVDLILSEFAEKFNYKINKIFVLPRGKGNSSQQMGSYGRTEVRKCVYLWEKR